MAISATRMGVLCVCLLGATIPVLPLGAETLEELDALSDATSDAENGIQMARDQAARGEHLEALATIERVLAENPKSREARLIHAIYLCNIDDVQGGLVEISRLKKKEYGKDLLNEARELCENREAT